MHPMIDGKFKILEWLGLGIMVFLLNWTLFLLLEYGSNSIFLQFQLYFLSLMALFIFWQLRYKHQVRVFWVGWRENLLAGLFIAIAFLSFLWTTSLQATIVRFVLLLSVTIIASYYGRQFTVHNLVVFIAMACGAMALASLFLILLVPSVAISPNWPYEGLWRGIFWHKIYLGATMALGYIANLVIIFSSNQQFTRFQKSLAAIMLLLEVVLAVKSDSASGLFVFAVQTGIFLIVVIWLKWGYLLSRWIYWLIGSGLALFGLLVLTNLGIVFSLFNRSANMTGRLPLWEYLIENFVGRRPLIGYGFGAFWQQPAIMEKIRSAVGWKYLVRVSDNGYMDVLLGLGIIGLLILIDY